jgi:hypothetical protein
MPAVGGPDPRRPGDAGRRRPQRRRIRRHVAGRPVNEFVFEDRPPGAVAIWWGSAAGPREDPLAVSQGDAGIPGRGEPGDAFGAAVAIRDTDSDGLDDLLIGAPGEDRARGSVTLVRGSRQGVTAVGSRLLRQGSGGIPGARRKNDRFGAALTLLRRRRGALPALLAGAPGEPSVSLIAASSSGSAGRADALSPARLGLRVPAEPPDALPGFGALLAQSGSS